MGYHKGMLSVAHIGLPPFPKEKIIEKAGANTGG